MADYSQEGLIEGIYAGEISIFALPDELFNYTYTEVIPYVNRGFSPNKKSLQSLEIWQSFVKNINETAGAKTFDEVLVLQNGVFNADGSKRQFSEFRDMALKIDDTYNIEWLKAEQDTAFKRGLTANQSIRIQEKKHIFPYLEYRTINDGRVRPEHAAYHGIIKPVDDEFWTTHYPPCDWRCRCRVESVKKATETNLEEHLEQFNKKQQAKGKPTVESLENPSKLFGSDPAKDKFIFDKKELSYFKQPAEFNELKKNNYGFGYREEAVDG